MPTTDKKVIFYVSPAIAECLAARAKRWLVPTSAFIRYCVETELMREAATDAKGGFCGSPSTTYDAIKDLVHG
jgi:hypothetical protein